MVNSNLEKFFFEIAEKKFDKKIFKIWIAPLNIKIENNEFILLVKNKFVMDWIKKNYESIFIDILHEISPTIKYLLKIEIDKQNNIENKIKITQVNKKKNKVKVVKNAYAKQLIDDYTFENFVEGESNSFALNAAKKVVEKLGLIHNPLFIYGETALGKTHLMNAIGHAVLENNPNKSVYFISAEKFSQEMAESIKNSKMTEFKNKYRNLDVLLIDDIQFFTGKNKSMDEFFYTFNSLLESQNQIVLTSDKYPKETDLESRLKSRLNWGLAVRILPPDLDTRKQILKKKASLQKKVISEEVADYMAKKIESHVRDLEGALNKVIAYSNFTGKEITIEMVNEQLKDLFTAQKNQIDIGNIQKIVSDYFKINIIDLIGKNKSKQIVRPRQIAMALTKEYTDYSLPEIGKNFGNRDHTTVINAIKRVKKLKEEDKNFNEDWETLNRKLRS